MKICTATGMIAAYMRLCGFLGWTSFWNTISGHERCHIKQIKRDGRLLFALKYSWWTLRRGYWNNPYEVEARAAEDRPL